MKMGILKSMLVKPRSQDIKNKHVQLRLCCTGQSALLLPSNHYAHLKPGSVHLKSQPFVLEGTRSPLRSSSL